MGKTKTFQNYLFLVFLSFCLQKAEELGMRVEITFKVLLREALSENERVKEVEDALKEVEKMGAGIAKKDILVVRQKQIRPLIRGLIKMCMIPTEIIELMIRAGGEGFILIYGRYILKCDLYLENLSPKALAILEKNRQKFW